MSKRYIIQVLATNPETGETTWENVKHPSTGTDWMTRRFDTATRDLLRLRHDGELRELALVESKPVYETTCKLALPAVEDIPGVKHDYDANGNCKICGDIVDNDDDEMSDGDGDVEAANASAGLPTALSDETVASILGSTPSDGDELWNETMQGN